MNINIKELFNKKFTFQKSTSWILPENDHILSSPIFLHFELLQLKDHLNSVKSQLNDFPIEDWSLHTRKRNPAGEVQWKLRSKYNAEFVTQAWCKMFECLCNYDLVNVSSDQKEFNSLHLCEAPGAFIAALNHFLRTKFKNLKYNWMATTLNPYYEGNEVSNMILDDRLILHTFDKWHFGSDFTGNIMDIKNINSLKNKCENIQPITLITADGSIDCVQIPQEQENKVADLHIYEVLTALLILEKSGNFIIKMFTFFECSSINILYLLNIVFASVNVFKPATSKAGNSEVYVICLGFNRSKPILDFVNFLLNKLNDNNLAEKSIFRRQDVPNDFLEQVCNCAAYFMRIQCSVIKDNIKTFHNPIAHHLIQQFKNLVSQHFLKKYQVEAIEENLKIVCGSVIFKSVNLNPRLHKGTYDERTKSMNNVELKNFLKDRYKIFNESNWIEKEYYKYLNKKETLDLKLCIVIGKSINTLCSSKFVFAPILNMYQQSLKICNNNALEKQDTIAFSNLRRLLQKEKFIWVVIDYKDMFVNYDDYEKNLFKKFCDLKISPGQNVAIVNFPTLTLFSVGVFYLLKNYYFENVAFVKHNCILFLNYKDRDKTYLKQIADNINFKKRNESILSVVPIGDICSGDFYDDILSFNNANLIFASRLLLYN